MAAAETGTRRPPVGWWVVAAKELGDHVTSLRFTVLLAILAIAVIVPVFFASNEIRDRAQAASEAPAVFLYLFTLPKPDIPIVVFTVFVGLLAPLLGIAFGFDSVNVERSEGTLPRLLAQPIHRDDVINGKFAAGLAVIGLIIGALTLLVAGFGIYRLGIVPSATEAVRLVAWLLVTIVYVGFWLAFATLVSVVVRRAATAALVAFGVWLGLTLFGGIVAGVLADFLAPTPPGATVEQLLARSQLLELLTRLSPNTLYQEATLVILNPGAGALDVSTPGSLDEFIQALQQIPSLHTLDQSLLLVWPQVVALVALMVICFAAAYVLFMRQEVRA